MSLAQTVLVQIRKITGGRFAPPPGSNRVNRKIVVQLEIPGEKTLFISELYQSGIKMINDFVRNDGSILFLDVCGRKGCRLRTGLSIGLMSTPFEGQVRLSQVQLRISQIKIRKCLTQLRLPQYQIRISQMQTRINQNQIGIARTRSSTNKTCSNLVLQMLLLVFVLAIC